MFPLVFLLQNCSSKIQYCSFLVVGQGLPVQVLPQVPEAWRDRHDQRLLQGGPEPRGGLPGNQYKFMQFMILFSVFFGRKIRVVSHIKADLKNTTTA